VVCVRREPERPASEGSELTVPAFTKPSPYTEYGQPRKHPVRRSKAAAFFLGGIEELCEEPFPGAGIIFKES
jgi:hypothetical protein